MPSSSSSCEAGLGGPEGVDGAHRRAGHLAQRLALGVPAGEVVGERSRWRHHLEGGVGDGLVDVVVDGDLGAAVDLHVLDEALVLLREVAGERVAGLVEVVVGVEDRTVIRGHGPSIPWGGDWSGRPSGWSVGRHA